MTPTTASIAGAPAAGRARLRGERRWTFVIPLLAVLGVTSVYPTVYSIYMSFFDWDWGHRFNFIGIDNYTTLLTSERFWNAMINTAVFRVGAVGVELLLGLGVALVVNRLGFGAGIVRTLLLVPLMVSGIVTAIIWKIMMDPTLGIIDYVLRTLGLPTPAFLGDPSTALASMVLIDTWWQTAFVFIVLSAGLRALPVEPFEAAEVDGAGAFARFRYVTLPLLRPIILTVLMFRTIDCMKVFAIIFGTTGGGPLTSTESIQILAYRAAFKTQQMSMSMTMMVVFSALIFVIVALYMRVGEREAVQ